MPPSHENYRHFFTTFIFTYWNAFSQTARVTGRPETVVAQTLVAKNSETVVAQTLIARNPDAVIA